MTSIRHVEQKDLTSWLRLRHALWPDASEQEHRAEIQRFLSGSAREPQAVLVACDEHSGALIGFAELSIRAYAEGCHTDRVAFLEGWYVAPEFRRRGIARALVAAAEEWATSNGCTEFASDTEIDNDVSAAAHRECGFVEVGVIRCFRKELSDEDRS
ncbi:MAG TPA: aminoglycoside 6'-N-acetyltransferase [Steroidobacter sp.]|uniref:aminoglycoside 6'-N-acetyltransferase n=1 Tax=Steroidobacter sp. TaxID=1978227 RepID=UPI002ED7D1B0